MSKYYTVTRYAEYDGDITITHQDFDQYVVALQYMATIFAEDLSSCDISCMDYLHYDEDYGYTIQQDNKYYNVEIETKYGE